MQRLPAIVASLLLLTLLAGACSHTPSATRLTLSRADSIMEQAPDSALAILLDIDTCQLRRAEDRAYYALLLSQAMDKNWIDTTDFSILQPAIDYYSDRGPADLRFRTLYYSGRIHDNRGDYDKAASCYKSALDMVSEITDSLCLARTHVNLAVLLYEIYDLDRAIDNALLAADIYSTLGHPERQLNCLKKAFLYQVWNSQSDSAKHTLSTCDSLASLLEDGDRCIRLERLIMHELENDTVGIKKIIQEFEADPPTIGGDSMNLAGAYIEIGEPQKGLEILNYLSHGNYPFEQIKYYLLKSTAFEALGDQKAAFDAFKKYERIIDKDNNNKFNQAIATREKLHEASLLMAEEKHTKNMILFGAIAAGVLLLAIIAILMLRSKAIRTRQHLAEEQRRSAELRADNLRLQVEHLREERDSLHNIIMSHDMLPHEASEVINRRIEKLNSIFADHITGRETDGESFQSLLEMVYEDKERFVSETRVVFSATHPRFIAHLRAHGLTDLEISYMCLFAIGLSGKEAGAYMNHGGHYNITSQIRRKLGLEGPQTPLSIYARRLLSDL